MLMSSRFEPASELSLPYYMIKKVLCFLQIIHDRFWQMVLQVLRI